LSRGQPQEEYRYFEIGKYAVCLDQSILTAVRTLGLGHAYYRLDSIGISNARAWRAVVIILKCKLGLGKPGQDWVLPVFGHIAMRVHRGNKVFDFRRSEVSKVFDESVSKHEAESEIRACETASAVTAAPGFVRSDSRAAWYTEEYIGGTHATDIVSPHSSDYLDHYQDVESCLIELAACRAPVTVDASAHIEQLGEKSYVERWAQLDNRGDDVRRIAAYMDGLQSWLLKNTKSGSLQLILTHGDFSLVNAISTPGGLRIVDWEGIGTGSLFSDLYNYMFTEHYYGRTSPDFTSEVETTLEKFRGAVLARCPELGDTASLPVLLVRRLYYLERLRLLLDRDVSLILLNVICKSVSMFSGFDDDVGDGSV